jgi:hypothetical protein
MTVEVDVSMLVGKPHMLANPNIVCVLEIIVMKRFP